MINVFKKYKREESNGNSRTEIYYNKLKIKSIYLIAG